MVKLIWISAAVLGVAWQGFAAETSGSPNATVAALEHSDFVFVCKMKDEGTGGQTPRGYFKSYFVTYPETLYFGLVGLNLPGEIWIYYESSEYPKVPKSGHELTFYKGDMFIAFLRYVKDSDKAFCVVRIDRADAKEEIRKIIKKTPNNRRRGTR